MKAPKTKQEATEIIMPYRKADKPNPKTSDMTDTLKDKMIANLLSQVNDLKAEVNYLEELKGRLAQYEPKKVQCIIKPMVTQNRN